MNIFFTLEGLNYFLDARKYRRAPVEAWRRPFIPLGNGAIFLRIVVVLDRLFSFLRLIAFSLLFTLRVEGRRYTGGYGTLNLRLRRI